MTMLLHPFFEKTIIILIFAAKESNDMKTLKVICVAAALCFMTGGAALAAGPEVLIPVPVKVELGTGTYTPAADGSDVRVHLAARQFAKELSALNLPDFAREEAYRLVVGRKGIDIYALTQEGVFRARTSVQQMLASDGTLPQCSILDYPRFRHRGLMLDISRNFRDKDFILKQLDAMAQLKMSTLHLHLTDDAGWRIQIDSYPELTSRAAWREGATYEEWRSGGHRYSVEGSPEARGGYLTKDDVREIVAYAADRYIEIIPEIEIPAHSGEVLAAYPELSCLKPDGTKANPGGDLCPGNALVYPMYEAILSEVIELFPSPYIHIGGDEAAKTNWKDCPVCQHLMNERGLKDVDELQSHMIGHFVNFLAEKGRHAIGWDEILQGGLPEGAAVMSWRGTEGGRKAAELGHDVVMSPGSHCYFDSAQDAPYSQPKAFSGYTSLERAYSFEPVPEGLSDAAQSHILGLQANLWSEYIPTSAQMEYMMYPRAFAIAEIGWSPAENKDYADFRGRAIALADRLRSQGYNPFELRGEIGRRPESLKPLEHLAVGAELTFNGRCRYNRGYPAGGDNALVDGQLGGWFYKDLLWQGYLCDVDVTLDLGSVKDIHYVGATFLSHTSAGVGFPVRTEVSFSEDGENFSEPVVCLSEHPDTDSWALLNTLGTVVNAKARYIRYRAVRDTVNPAHAFIFIDEIVVN